MELDHVNFNMISDADIAAQMRKFNYEKFKTLVRMHLSFELDLNTDEFDLPCHEIVYEDKGKVRKWSRLSKKQKHVGGTITTGCASTSSKGSGSAENSPIEALHQQINAGFLLHLQELKAFLLLEKNLNQEGIFRKTGSISRQNELRQQIQNDKPLDMEGGGYSAHDCATVFKGYLANLHEPLLTDAHYPAHQQIAPLCLGAGSCRSSSTSTLTRPVNPERVKREEHLLSSVQLLLLLLPDENRQLLQHIIEILHAVAARESRNKMTPENLATIFAPHLICPRNLPAEALHYTSKTLSSIIAYMVCKGSNIFEMPAKLSTDIRAYFMERKRKKTMSPEQTLDESISDMSTVNTVYTFVDREKTAAAHTANNTDTELAQLYAHIQSLPESSKKRRLIKQFNKQNGQGTPLQLVVLNRLKGTDASRSAKSIGDSIKKHIFHKNIMSRTPKRSSTATTTPPTGFGVGVETPNCANTNKNPKLRVLFRSPAPSQISQHYSTVTTPIHSSSSSTSTTSLQSLHVTNHAITNKPSSSCMKTLKHHPLHKSISSTSLISHPSAKLQCKLSALHHTNTEASETSSHSSTSSECLPTVLVHKYDCSISTPVSRQISHETNVCADDVYDISRLPSNCSVLPLKYVSKADTNTTERKTVAWDDTHLLDIEEISNPCTPIQQNSIDYKSRYKSEPNLSCVNVLSSSATSAQESATKYTSGSRSLTRKLMKGVNMNSLKFHFVTPESTKRLVRNVSSTLRRRSAGDDQVPYCGASLTPDQAIEITHEPTTTITDVLEDLDDETFEDNPDDQLDSDSDLAEEQKYDNFQDEYGSVHDIGSRIVNGANNNSHSSDNSATRYRQQLMLQQSGVYRNLDLITSTPSLLFGRRSMSPITKSTQRMPKAMQESIMTPRSRKPVMVLTTTTHSANDQNQTICQREFSSLHEQDEDESRHSYSSKLSQQKVSGTTPDQIDIAPHLQCEDATSLDSYTELVCGCRPVLSDVQHSQANVEKVDALSSYFKKYLLSRSVLASPVDSSFSSQPDDFGSPQYIEELNDSQLSPGLLYCLDGNEPDENTFSGRKSKDLQGHGKFQSESFEIQTTNGSNSKYCTPHKLYCHNQLFALNNARKRAATSDFEAPLEADTGATMGTVTHENHSNKSVANKENIEQVEGYLRSRKLLISEYPGETSF